MEKTHIVLVALTVIIAQYTIIAEPNYHMHWQAGRSFLAVTTRFLVPGIFGTHDNNPPTQLWENVQNCEKNVIVSTRSRIRRLNGKLQGEG